MKRRWLPAMLLRGSMASSLAGGGAPAPGVQSTAGQACCGCWWPEGESRGNTLGPPEDRLVESTIGGWDSRERGFFRT